MEKHKMKINNGKRVCIVEIMPVGLMKHNLKNVWIAELDSEGYCRGNIYLRTNKTIAHALKTPTFKDYSISRDMLRELEENGTFTDHLDFDNNHRRAKKVGIFLVFKNAKGAIDYLVTNWLSEKLVGQKNVLAAARAITNVRLWM